MALKNLELFTWVEAIQHSAFGVVLYCSTLVKRYRFFNTIRAGSWYFPIILFAGNFLQSCQLCFAMWACASECKLSAWTVWTLTILLVLSFSCRDSCLRGACVSKCLLALLKLCEINHFFNKSHGCSKCGNMQAVMSVTHHVNVK